MKVIGSGVDILWSCMFVGPLMHIAAMRASHDKKNNSTSPQLNPHLLQTDSPFLSEIV